MIPARSDTWISYVYLLDVSFPEVASVYFVTIATNTVERSDTWISYVYLLDLSFREVASVYFVTIATNTVERTIVAFGCLLKLAFFMKHE